MKKLLLLAGCAVTAVAANAATVYIDNQVGYTNPALYAWATGEPELFGAWPGATANGTATVNGVEYLKFDVPAEGIGKQYNLIFNGDNGQQDVATVTFEDKDYFYTVTEPVEAETANYIYILNEVGYEPAKLYGWGAGPDSDLFGGWPGADPVGTETVDGSEYLKYAVPATAIGKGWNLIFNNNAGGQLKDFEIDNLRANDPYYFVATEQGLQAVTPTTPEPVNPDHLYVFGNLYNENWLPATAHEMDKDGNIFTIRNLAIQTAYGEPNAFIAFTTVQSDNWDLVNSNRLGATTDGYAVEFGVPTGFITPTENTFGVFPTNPAEDGLFYVDVVVDYEAKTVMFIEVKDDTEEIEYFDLYVLGEFNMYTASDEYLMKRNGNVYTYDFKDGINIDEPDGGFIICSYDGDWTFGAKEYGQRVELGETVDAWFGAQYFFNVFYVTTTEPTKVTLTIQDGSTVEDAVVPAKLSFESTTGVAELDADNTEAVYFNLQGVRVANPENGLFIKVQGTKTTKVAL